MAFVRTKLGGNIVASSKQSSLFIYKSADDALAVIGAVDYFKEANGSAPTPQPPGFQGNADNILYANDIILIEGSDGFGVGQVLADGASVNLVLSEV